MNVIVGNKYEHSADQPRVILLGAALRRLRVDNQWGLRELARKLGTNPALLSNWELGQRTPAVEDVACYLGALGIVGQDKERILRLARTLAPGVVISGDQTVPHHLATLLDVEATAKKATIWEPVLVPDLLQLPDYAREVLRALGRSPGKAAELVELRKFRDGILHGPKAKPITAYIGDTVLTKPAVSAMTTAAQLWHLATLNRKPNQITVRVVPFGISNHPALASAWSLYKMSRPVVYLNHLNSATFVDDQSDYYARAVTELDKIALTDEETTQALIQFAAKHADPERQDNGETTRNPQLPPHKNRRPNHPE